MKLLAAAVILVAALPALPMGAAATAGTVLDTAVDSTAVTGELGLSGTLASFRSALDPVDRARLGTPQGPPPASRIAPTELRLSGASIRVDTDHLTGYGSPYAASQSIRPERVVVDAATAVTRPAREGFLFFVAPFPGSAAPSVTTAASFASLTAATGGASSHMFVPTDRTPVQEPTVDLVSTDRAGLRTLRIEGDFVLMLWEWDLVVSNATRSQTFQSGYTYAQWVPSEAGFDFAGRYDERQVYVYVRGGSLSATMSTGAATVLTMLPKTGHMAGRIEFSGPSTPPGWIEGSLDLSFASFAPKTFGLAVAGQPSAASFAVTPQSASASPNGLAWLPWLVAAGVLAGLLLALGARWLAVNRSLKRLKVAMAVGDYAGVVAQSRPGLMRLRRFGDSVRAQKTVALLLMGRVEEAAGTLDGWRRGHEATRDYLWACVHAARGEAAQAAARLQACLTHDPVLGRQLLGDPLLATVSKPPEAAASSSKAVDNRAEGYV